MLFKPQESENPGLRFSVDGKHFKKEHLENGSVKTIRIIILSCPRFPQSQIQNCVLKFLRRSMDGKKI